MMRSEEIEYNSLLCILLWALFSPLAFEKDTDTLSRVTIPQVILRACSSQVAKAR
jgi:hypothetical protein